MTSSRLRILCLSQLPPSPPRFGAQARIHGLWAALGRRHDLSFVSLVDEEFDVEECRRSMSDYCQEVYLLPNPRGRNGMVKRSLQLRSLASLHSFEYHRYQVPALDALLDEVHRRTPFDLVNLEFPYLAHVLPSRPTAGRRAPPLVIDAHEIAHDLVRQLGQQGSRGRRVYAAVNWRKLRKEENAAYRGAEGVYVCSTIDRDRVLAEVPGTRTEVVPNAADVDFYRPRPADPPADGRTVVFFGLLSTLPNIDGLQWFVRAVWPRITEACPEARLEVLGKGAPPMVEALAGPGIEVVGFVADLRPHLARAATVVVPLRIGGGTRLKIVEGMAMGKAIVSTSLGAEGIEASPEVDLLLADDAEGFAGAVIRLLRDPALAGRIGASARQLAEERYSWASAASTLEGFFHRVLEGRA